MITGVLEEIFENSNFLARTRRAERSITTLICWRRHLLSCYPHRMGLAQNRIPTSCWHIRNTARRHLLSCNEDTRLNYRFTASRGFRVHVRPSVFLSLLRAQGGTFVPFQFPFVANNGTETAEINRCSNALCLSQLAGDLTSSRN